MSQTISFHEFKKRTRNFPSDTFSWIFQLKREASDYPNWAQNLECLYQKYMMDKTKKVNPDVADKWMSLAEHNHELAYLMVDSYKQLFCEVFGLICDIRETIYNKKGEDMPYIQKYSFLLDCDVEMV